MVEGIHWLAEQDMADVAWKLLAAALSDLAAKGAEPLGVLLSYQLGGDEDAFLRGLEEALRAFDVPLLGGDTTGSRGPRSFGVTAIGKAGCGSVPDRRGGRAGDVLHVTGVIGRAMLGFEALRAGRGDSAPYRRPAPLLKEGRLLAPVVTAMMDVSDGLLLDAQRLALASGLTIDIDTAAVPVADPSRRDACLRWGDDYQLLFALPPDCRSPVPAHAIGRLTEREPAALCLDGLPVDEDDGLGFLHE